MACADRRRRHLRAARAGGALQGAILDDLPAHVEEHIPSVRLRQGFENVQTVHGVQTLRIPTLLFNEKQRTQARFKVSSCVCLRQYLNPSTRGCC